MLLLSPSIEIVCNDAGAAMSLYIAPVLTGSDAGSVMLLMAGGYAAAVLLAALVMGVERTLAGEYDRSG